MALAEKCHVKGGKYIRRNSDGYLFSVVTVFMTMNIS